MRVMLVVLLVLLVAGVVSAQTPTPNEFIYATLTGGQMSRFDYSATASDVHIANLLTALLVSAWGMFFTGVFVFLKRNR